MASNSPRPLRSKIAQEIVGWRGNMKKGEAYIAILLSLIPSACDVSSDYSYAKTWYEEGFNPQIKALVYFFICLLHLVTLLTVTRWWIYKTLAGCSSCILWVKRLGNCHVSLPCSPGWSHHCLPPSYLVPS